MLTPRSGVDTALDVLCRVTSSFKVNSDLSNSNSDKKLKSLNHDPFNSCTLYSTRLFSLK